MSTDSNLVISAHLTDQYAGPYEIGGKVKFSYRDSSEIEAHAEEVRQARANLVEERNQVLKSLESSPTATLVTEIQAKKTDLEKQQQALGQQLVTANNNWNEAVDSNDTSAQLSAHVTVQAIKSKLAKLQSKYEIITRDLSAAQAVHEAATVEALEKWRAEAIRKNDNTRVALLRQAAGAMAHVVLEMAKQDTLLADLVRRHASHLDLNGQFQALRQGKGRYSVYPQQAPAKDTPWRDIQLTGKRAEPTNNGEYEAMPDLPAHNRAKLFKPDEAQLAAEADKSYLHPHHLGLAAKE